MKERWHDLKVWPSFFDALASGDKSFEVRRNDRDFQVGERVVLREWDPSAYRVNPQATNIGGGDYTGRQVERVIVHVHDLGRFNVAPGFVVLGLRTMGTG